MQDVPYDASSSLYSRIIQFATVPVLILLLLFATVIIRYLFSAKWLQARRNKQIRKAQAQRKREAEERAEAERAARD